MLVTTQTANKLIADVWFARADFARDNPGIIEGPGPRHLRLHGRTEEARPEGPPAPSSWPPGYNVPGEDAIKMFDDAHNTNWAENNEFFVNQNNPTNFERVWQQSYRLYRQIGTIQNPAVRFDQVMDLSIIQKLAGEEKYKSQKDEYQIQLTPKTVGEIRAESPEILTNTVVIRFFPNDWDLNKKITRKTPDGKDVEQLYDPNVDSVLEGIAQLVGKFRSGPGGHRGSHRRLDARAGFAGPGARAFAEPGQLGQGSPDQQVQARNPRAFRSTAWGGTGRPIPANR